MKTNRTIQGSFLHLPAPPGAPAPAYGPLIAAAFISNFTLPFTTTSFLPTTSFCSVTANLALECSYNPGSTQSKPANHIVMNPAISHRRYAPGRVGIATNNHLPGQTLPKVDQGLAQQQPDPEEPHVHSERPHHLSATSLSNHNLNINPQPGICKPLYQVTLLNHGKPVP